MNSGFLFCTVIKERNCTSVQKKERKKGFSLETCRKKVTSKFEQFFNEGILKFVLTLFSCLEQNVFLFKNTFQKSTFDT